MPPRVTYLPTDLYRQVKETALQNTADEAVADLGWGSVLDSALSGLRDTYRRATNPASPGPGPEMPIVVSERPEVRGIDLPDYGRAAEGAPMFHVDDFSTGEDGETLYTPGAGAARSAGAGMGASGAPASGAGQAPSDFSAYVRQAAAARGLDPEQVAAVMGKEGPSGWDAVGRFDTGESYGPLQLHYAGGSNPQRGMGDDFTRDTGIDLRQDRSIGAHQAAVDYALDRLSKTGDFREWYGADPALGSRFTPVKRIAAVPMADAGPAAGALEPFAINQITQGAAEGLTPEQALAVCGPAATLAFAKANGGRLPTLKEATDLAQRLGLWSTDTGMRGPQAEARLLDAMGIANRLDQGADEATIAAEVAAGRPVVVDSPGHYYVATGYDPVSRQFEFGESARVLKASGGRSRYRLDELAALGMGAPRSTIRMVPR